MRHLELLVPASSPEVLKIAVIYGADAVYIGGEAFGLRSEGEKFFHEGDCGGNRFCPCARRKGLYHCEYSGA